MHGRQTSCRYNYKLTTQPSLSGTSSHFRPLQCIVRRLYRQAFRTTALPSCEDIGLLRSETTRREKIIFWHCPRTTRSSVCVAVRCLPACLFHSSAAAARGRFAAVCPASRRYSHAFDGDAHWRQMANTMDRPVRRRRCGLLSSPLLSRASSLRSLYREGKCADTMLAQCWFRGLATHFQR